MPYIKQEERKRYDDLIAQVTTALLNKYTADNGKNYSEGDLNYIISSIIWKLFDAKPCYANINKLVGALHCVITEFERRKAAPYEDLKEKENGDINLDKQ